MKWLRVLLILNVLPLLSGCTIGPKTETVTTFVQKYDTEGRPVIIGTVAKNVKVPVQYTTKSGGIYTQQLDIGGWDVSPPPLPKAPEK